MTLHIDRAPAPVFRERRGMPAAPPIRLAHIVSVSGGHAVAMLERQDAITGADSRVRQNLALVVGLQGRFDEAEKIASAELSADQAAANVAYLKQMLAQQNNWQKLKSGGDAPAKKRPG